MKRSTCCSLKTIMLTLTDHEKHITDDFARFSADRFAG